MLSGAFAEPIVKGSGVPVPAAAAVGGLVGEGAAAVGAAAVGGAAADGGAAGGSDGVCSSINAGCSSRAKRELSDSCIGAKHLPRKANGSSGGGGGQGDPAACEVMFRLLVVMSTPGAARPPGEGRGQSSPLGLGLWTKEVATSCVTALLSAMAVRAAIALLLLAVLPLVLAAEGKHSVIVIADPGVDDAGALLLALASPSIHLLGVVSSFGGHPDPRLTARNAQRLIEAAGREADVPVIVGAAWPLGLGQPLSNGGSAFHGPDGLGGVLGELAPEPEPAACNANESSAAEFIAQSARRMPGEIHLLCFSPLTNVALALSLEPRLPSLLKGFYVMGGAVHGVGNAAALGEANFVHDAAAARAVVAAWGAAPDACNLVMAPLELTHQSDTLISANDVEAWRVASGGAADLFAGSWPFYAKSYCTMAGWCEAMPLHDAHPVTYLLQPNIYKGETMRVQVLATTPGNPEHGMSLVDRRSGALMRARTQPPAPGECDAHVLMSVDGQAYRRLVDEGFEELGRRRRRE